MEYEAVIGLEVHVQLKTKTKVFCGCSTEFGQEPNSQVCPICLGFPGVLPVFNKVALDYALKVAVALNCRISEYTKFDRKNYFYPDLPKNYQISQYDLPLAGDGFLDIYLNGARKRIGIKRVHLEEDAGKLIHTEDSSFIDFNRTGIPLLEIVSLPQISSSQEAHEYLISLKRIIRYLDVSDCDMEKGTLRCDANVSVKKKTDARLGTKIELKNMNSFKGVRDALDFEIKRQIDLLEQGGSVIQETRAWDAGEQQTQSMRTKEEAQDYRYFPEPDLPVFIINSEMLREIRDLLPELPRSRLERFLRDYRLSDYDAQILVSEKEIADFFEACYKLYPEAKVIANWIKGAILSELNSRNLSLNELGISPSSLIGLIRIVQEGGVSNIVAKGVLTQMIDTKKTAEEIIKEKNLVQISDMKILEEIIDEVITENPSSIKDFYEGKENAIMFLVGCVMKKSKGKANPKIAQELLRKKMKEVKNA